MGAIDARAGLPYRSDNLIDLQTAASRRLELARERPVGRKFGYQEGTASVQVRISNWQNMRIAQVPERFGPEPGATRGEIPQKLDRDNVTLMGVASAIGVCLSTAAQRGNDLIPIADQRRYCCHNSERTDDRLGMAVTLRVVGIAVDARDPKRPLARLALADNGTGSVVIVTTLELPSDSTATATQLHDAAEALRSHLKSLGPDRVVVRRADRSARARQTDGPKFRLLMEGALTSTACSVVPDTLIGTGKETAEWFGSSKEELDREAERILSAGSHPAKFGLAMSAALAGLALRP
jgi:hypothetical protein